jgi:heme A synthase
MTKSNRFAYYAWLVVAVNLFVILWGAYVRASGSGAGCGSHWPLCNGQVLPRAPETATLIELTHRLTSGVALLMVIGLVVWSFRSFPKKHQVRVGAVLSFAFIVSEALIGAGLVLFELVADNASIARAMFMSVHLVNTFTLLAFLTLTAWWGSGGPPVRLRDQGYIVWLFALTVMGTVLLAVSGAVAALGDTLFPSGSLAQGLSDDFSSTTHLLIRLRLLHPLLAISVGAIAVLVAGIAKFKRPGKWVQRWMSAVNLLVVVQILVGLLNVSLLAPIWLQLVHLLLADLVWLALVLLMASTLGVPVETDDLDEAVLARRPAA